MSQFLWYFYFLGGSKSRHNQSNEIYMFDNDGWVFVSHMLSSRAEHAVTTITFDQELEKYCIPASSLASTTTQMTSNIPTTESSGFCDFLCLRVKADSWIGPCCQSTICECLGNRSDQYVCPPETLWCPETSKCIMDCQTDCGCQS